MNRARRCWRVWGGAMLVYAALAAPILTGQTRDAYRDAYREWQQSDPGLERDAASAGEALTPRTEKAAADAGKFMAARRAFYEAQRAALIAQLTTLQASELPVETDGEKAIEATLSSQEASIANSIQLFGGDSDPGIQQLHRALEKERQTLIALKSSIQDREKEAAAVAESNDNVNHAMARAGEEMKALSASFAQSAETAGVLAQGWPAYYRALASGARGLAVTETVPGLLDPPDNGAAGAAVHRAAPQSRFAGLWSFEFGVSTYKGPSPFSFDVFVREEGGQILGSLSAHYVGTGKTDANVGFDFSGPVQAEGSQSFPVQADSVKGTVELIPGTAPNLLEVNFKLEGGSGKVRESGAVLVKH